MAPVVNGLQEKYESEVEFLILNAGFGDGKEAFEHYRLPGHPSFVLLNPQGEVTWQAFGPQAEASLEAAVLEALDASTSDVLTADGS